MTKVLSTISIVLLFIISGLIFWAGLSPQTFFNYFARYSIVTKTVTQSGLLGSQINNLPTATTSEPVLSKIGQVIIRGSAWEVEIANTDALRVNGLSNRKILYSKNGMLFVFDKMSEQSFWMKDMLIPLDMIFFDNNWKIVEIDSDVEPSSFPKIFGGDVKSQYVLEINAGEAAGYALQAGDQAIFLNK